MNDNLRVSGYELRSDASCLVEVDEHVPLRFRTHERPLGSNRLRLGDLEHSLVELLVDPMTGILRGVTITWFRAFSAWPIVNARDVSQGLPVLATSWERKNYIDTGVDFSVSARGTEILVYWRSLDHCDASTFNERVRFLAVDGHLAGVHFTGLSGEEMKQFVNHASPA